MFALGLGGFDSFFVCVGVVRTLPIWDDMFAELSTYLLDVAGQSIQEAGRSGPLLGMGGRIIVFCHVVVQCVNGVVDGI